jgi:hypothetical protein
MNDHIGSAHMTQGSSTNFTFDRFGNTNSALALNGGWTQVPPGIYFNTTEFTISVWLYPMNVGSHARIIDFGNGAGYDNFVFSLSIQHTIQPYFLSLPLASFVSPTILPLNQWQFLVLTFNGANINMYKNGQMILNTTINNYTLPVIKRTRCYFGRSNWYGNGYSWSIMDDLRFYNKSLIQAEILELMNYNETSKKKDIENILSS